MDKPFTLKEMISDISSEMGQNAVVILRCDCCESESYYEGATITPTEVKINIPKDKVIS